MIWEGKGGIYIFCLLLSSSVSNKCTNAIKKAPRLRPPQGRASLGDRLAEMELSTNFAWGEIC